MLKKFKNFTPLELTLILGISFCIFLFFYSFLRSNSKETTLKEEVTTIVLPKNQIRSDENTNQLPQQDTQQQSTAQIQTQQPQQNTQQNQQQKQLYKVFKVVDGDTIKVETNGTIETIRLIGINTPETVDPRKPVECFGIEASNKAKELLNGKSVYLETDNTQDNKDKYGRLLAYVFLEDGTNFNKLMIQEGYAYEYTYNYPYKYQAEFKQAQTQAMNENKGLWNQNTCNGNTTTTTDTNQYQNTNQNNNYSASPQTTTQTTNSNEPPVKKSSSGICHSVGTTYYNRTKNYTPYNSIDECLASGGRLPKR